MSKVIAGDTWHKRYRFYNQDGTLASPDTIVGWVKQPDNTVTTTPFTATEDSTGIYDLYVETSEPAGIWYLEVTASGSIVGETFEETICVAKSSVA